MDTKTIQRDFTTPLLTWFQKHGRHDLPWKNPTTPYRVWISEVMLQQTQVKTVTPYFLRFINRFPDVHSLASAQEDEVLNLWSGLGYYTRARNLHKAANTILNDFQGNIPDKTTTLIQLPGIGLSTAAAIASLAYNQPTAILDGNVKRILSRYFMISGSPEATHVNQKLWELAQQCMPLQQCAAYTQAIMDLGASCCTIKQPSCAQCPVQFTCLAYKNNETSNYPGKKKKRIKPNKSRQFLLIHAEKNTFYLEKQPTPGLWGGLWCTPMIEEDQCPMTHIQNNYHLTPINNQPLLTFKHTFSHFHLTIEALSIEVRHMHKMMKETNSGRWIKRHDLNRLGLAKPMQTIFNRFLETHK